MRIDDEKTEDKSNARKYEDTLPGYAGGLLARYLRWRGATEDSTKSREHPDFHRPA